MEALGSCNPWGPFTLHSHDEQQSNQLKDRHIPGPLRITLTLYVHCIRLSPAIPARTTTRFSLSLKARLAADVRTVKHQSQILWQLRLQSTAMENLKSLTQKCVHREKRWGQRLNELYHRCLLKSQTCIHPPTKANIPANSLWHGLSLVMPFFREFCYWWQSFSSCASSIWSPCQLSYHQPYNC